MLEKMTESLFAETLKRIAEDVWKTKFEDIAPKLSKYHSSQEVVEKLLTKVLLNVLEEDKELRQKFENAFAQMLNQYLDKLCTKK